MKTRYWILIILGMIILGSIAYYAAYMYSLKQVEIKDVEFNLAEISLKGAAVKGDVVLENKGIVGVTVEEIKIDIRIDGQRLGGAIVQGDKIAAGAKEKYPMEVDIDWAPTAQAAIDLLQQKNNELIIEGKVKVGMHALRFEKRIDLTEYLLQFTTEKIVEKMPDVRAALEKAQEKINEIFG